jgi:hypothetical protein
MKIIGLTYRQTAMTKFDQILILVMNEKVIFCDNNFWIADKQWLKWMKNWNISKILSYLFDTFF